MRVSTRLLLSVSVFAFVVQGCRCPTGETVRPPGDARLVYVDPATGTELEGEDGVYDFGVVSMGKSEIKKLIIRNVGRGPLTVQTFTKVSGAPAKVGSAIDEPSPIFTIGFAGEVSIPSGSSQELDITFAPPVLETLEQQYETVLTMVSGNTEQGRENAQLTLRGTAISGTCDLPATIDFGAVARGDSAVFEYTFTNSQPIDARAYLGPIESQQGAGIFSLSPDSPRGEFLLPSMRSKTATFTFKPTENREYAATVRMRRAEGCPERPVRLIGLGVDAVLSWSPSPVDFGYAAPGTTVERELTFSNLSLQPRRLTLATKETASPTGVTSNLFRVVETGSTDLTTITVPAGSRDASAPNGIAPGTVTLRLSFKPLVLGPRAHFLVVTTELQSQPAFSVGLSGVGGGPDVDVRPSPTLNFGRVGYFPAAAPPSFATRKLTVQNVGTRPAMTDPRAHLKLGRPDGAGGTTRPYWEVVPKPGSSADELCVGVFDTALGRCTDDLPTSGPGGYDPAFGLQAGAAGLLDIPVRLTPNGVGMREFDVRIFTNDPDEPVTTITVTANAVVLPECDVEITPASLAYGIVSPPSIRDLAFTLRNRRTGAGEFCLVSNLQLLLEQGTPAGMPPVFSLPAGAIDEIELAPGEVRQVMVRAWPQGALPPVPAQVAGRVSMNVASPTQPQREVALTATIANSCLTISPSSLDFGTVKKDCNSPNRTFQIYNTCSSEVLINAASMASPAGEPPGGPNCAGNAPCPEFFVVSGIPAGTRVAPGSSTPVTFELKYRPINFGPDSGAFVLNVTQGGQPLDYVVTLQGRGDATGLNTDTFRQNARPQADILLVIDDSGSMGPKQEALGGNMAAFLQYSTSNQVDFHIAVTNTELTDPGRGKFCSGSGTTGAPCPRGNTVLRPTTPNLSTQFNALVNVGTHGGSESCMEPATRALTSPYISDPSINGGFLRPDAFLAVVCVTDARDQAPQPPAFYLNQLINVKGAQRPGLFTYNVIGPFLPTAPMGCSYDGPSDDGRHAFMVSQTNGVKEEICTPTWADALARLGERAFGYRTTFFLTSRPDLTQPITVSIDGDALPMMDPDFNARIWEYDATSNAVQFQPLFVPEPGKTLTVTYTAACIP